MQIRGIGPGVLLASIIGLTGCGGSGSQAPGPGGSPGAPGAGTVEVGVVTLTSESVDITRELPGRVVAYATAEIRPQVDGIVRRIAFTEGAPVETGDVLFELDALKFSAAVTAAQANVNRAQASLAGARAVLERRQQLGERQAVSQQDIEDARTAVQQAEADVLAAQADLETAQINLRSATIRAPIPGLIGKSSVSVGSLVTGNQATPLATIRQIDPIYVELVDSSAYLIRLREWQAEDSPGTRFESPPKVAMTLENLTEYPDVGTLSLRDVVVSETTSTILLRATFPNPDQLLLPGMFVRSTILIGTISDGLLVPQRAVSHGADGQASAFFVNEEDRAERRDLQLRYAIGNDWLLFSGASAGDRLIVDGLQRINEGTEVAPVPAAIDERGVVHQELPDPAAVGP